MSREINQIIIHCSASKFGSATMIDSWHKERGFGTTNATGEKIHAGYHYVIQNGHYRSNKYIDALNGSIEVCRDVEIVGAHAKGHNKNSIGICLIGEGDFTDAQYLSLMRLVCDLMIEFGISKENVIGHNQVSSKECPCFDVGEFVAGL